MQPFTAKAVQVIRSIPEGKVMSYGQVAAAAGSPRAARQVVRILHSMSRKHNLPWHRVVNKYGEIAIQEDESSFEQRALLEEEGIIFSIEQRIDLTKYSYSPSEEDLMNRIQDEQ